MKALLGIERRDFLDSLAWAMSRRELKGLMKRTELSDIVNSTFAYQGRGHYARIRSVQVPSEILRLAEAVQAAEPQVIVEIGTYKGGTLFIWARSNTSAKQIVSIDLPGGRYGGGYDERRTRLYREFVRDNGGTAIDFIRGDSHEPGTLDQLRSVLEGRPIDFLYIDGDHTYEGVKQDFETYSPLVRPGGLVAFHDIVTSTQDCGVDRFWNEIKHGFEHQEFVEVSSNKGIGLITYGQPRASVAALNRGRIAVAT